MDKDSSETLRPTVTGDAVETLWPKGFPIVVTKLQQGTEEAANATAEHTGSWFGKTRIHRVRLSLEEC